MARANRHHIPGYIWHITHRCHKGEFLLKFAKDRRRWCSWLFEARKRFGLCVLNYTVTSNHIHLLVFDTGEEVIARSIQLIAGRTAQQYNQRKNRKGAFWEDRYHATAVESGPHLIACLVYIDLNMVRAGVVTHPSEWPFGGYKEIQAPPRRYRLIDRERLMNLLGISDSRDLVRSYGHWVADVLGKSVGGRDEKWTKSLAVGGRAFVEETKQKLGIKAIGRKIAETSEGCVLKESRPYYGWNFSTRKSPLSTDNTLPWDVFY